MTLRECQIAAYWRIPVVSDGVPYRRIMTVSIQFRDPEAVRSAAELEPWYEVVLESETGRSITHALPRDVMPREPETFGERVKQYYAMKGGESVGQGTGDPGRSDEKMPGMRA